MQANLTMWLSNAQTEKEVNFICKVEIKQYLEISWSLLDLLFYFPITNYGLEQN